MQKLASSFLIILSFCACLSGEITAQTWGRMDSVSFLEGTDTFKNPFSGGLNLPQFSTIDLNNDLIDDLFIFDREDDKVLTFINRGTPSTVDYVHAPEYESAFPPLKEWALLRDYNCDGKPDIFTSNLVTGVKVYRNTSTGSSISFVEEISLLQSDYGTGPENLFVIDYDIPAIADVDGDGDLDILTFDAPGVSVEYHQNQAIQLGDCDTLAFQLLTACWGNFEESSFDNSITLGVTCKAGATGFTAPDALHSGSTLCTFDEDGDGDLEILIGDLLSTELAYLHNTGDSLIADMDTTYFGFPSYDTPADMDLFVSSFYIDVNNDGQNDLIAAPNAKGAGINFENVWYYIDDGLAPNVSFGFRSTQFLQNEMIDLGAGAFPVAFDHNADGLQDLLVGNVEILSPSENYSGLTLFENVGTLSEPSFKLITRDYGGFSSLFTPTRLGFVPAIGDMDADGDVDLILGDADGKIHWMENSAGPGATVNFSIPHFDFMGIDIGNFATPFIVDLDRDSLPDLVIGEQRGNLNYFPNIGTSASPMFASTPDSDTLGGIDTDPVCCDGFSVPFFFENPVTGKYELMVGSEYGGLMHYAGIDSNVSGTYTLLDSAFEDFYIGEKVAGFSADLNNDTEVEWILGNARGGLVIFSQSPIMTVRPDLEKTLDFEIFPNPARDQITIRLNGLKSNQSFHLYIVDQTGRMIMDDSFTGSEYRFQIGSLSAGLYRLILSDPEMNRRESKNLLKLED